MNVFFSCVADATYSDQYIFEVLVLWFCSQNGVAFPGQSLRNTIFLFGLQCKYFLNLYIKLEERIEVEFLSSLGFCFKFF